MRTHRLIITGSLVLMTLAAVSTTAGEPVVAYRNGGSGAYPDADPPLEWSIHKNVKWHWQPECPMLETTISTPIIVGERIFTLARPMTLVCIDKNTGEVLWKRERHLTDGATVDATVQMIHDVIVRDARIHQLKYRLGHKKGGGPMLDGGHKFSKARGRGPTAEKDEAYHRKMEAQHQALFADGEANRAAYEEELAALEATLPRDKKGRIPSRAFRGTGYTTAAAPASDGERVVAIFAPGLVVCYDLSGQLQWTQAIVQENGLPEECTWGAKGMVPYCVPGDEPGTAGRVLVNHGSAMRCYNMATGEQQWAVRVPKHEACCAASPSVGNAGGGWFFMTVGGHVRSMADGSKVLPADPPLWGGQCYAMAVDSAGRTLHSVGIAARLPEEAGELPRTLWALAPKQCFNRKMKLPKDHLFVVGDSHAYSAPVVHDGLIYHRRTGGNGIDSLLDAETGEVLYGPKVSPVKGKSDYSNLVLAGKYLFYFHDRSATAYILTTDRDNPFQIVGKNYLERTCANEPVFEGRRMYMRTPFSLFCIEKPEEGSLLDQ